MSEDLSTSRETISGVRRGVVKALAILLRHGHPEAVAVILGRLDEAKARYGLDYGDKNEG